MPKWYWLLISVGVGGIFSLLLFGFITPIFPQFDITYSFQTSIGQVVSLLGTWFAVIAALAIAIWGSRLKEWGGYKPDLQIIGQVENIQGIEGQTRLGVVNKGKTTAQDVEIYINNLFDQYPTPRDQFFPVPLSWTHSGMSKRDLHPHQIGYVDLCRVSGAWGIAKLVLSAGQDVSTYEDIKPGNTTLELVIFQKSGQIKVYYIDLIWNKGDKLVHISEITEGDEKKWFI